MNQLFQPPGHFLFNAADWHDCYADWSWYNQLTEIGEKSDAVKISALLYNIGTLNAEKVMQTFQYGKKRIPDPGNEPATKQVDEKDTCYEVVFRLFEHHYVPKINVVNKSAKFNKWIQGDESIDSFLIDLLQLVISCDYQARTSMSWTSLSQVYATRSYRRSYSSWQTSISIKL